MIIYLRPTVAGGLVQPTRAPRASSAQAASAADPWAGLLGLAPSGVYRATPVTWGAGGLLHHRFTLTCRQAVCFLWHCPAGHPGWALPTTLLCGVRTFLSSCEPRSSGRLVRPRVYSLDAPFSTRRCVGRGRAGQRPISAATAASSWSSSTSGVGPMASVRPEAMATALPSRRKSRCSSVASG